jgi:formylglycine-generating enzyme required for sulfatase activity
MSESATTRHTLDLALPGLLLAGLVSLIGVQTAIIPLPHLGAARPPVAETVIIAPRAFDYRASGDFLRGSAAVDGPMIHVANPAELEIMTYQVSAADYAQCVADGACKKAEPRKGGTGNVPATGVSFDDASDYAVWVSRRTGATWRLPTVEEWVFAAGSKAVDHALGVETDATDPAKRWLLAYAREAALGGDGPLRPEPLGSFGFNEFGVADLSAVVWEWTATCANRTTLGDAGEVLTYVESCGVRYIEGRHRTPMSTFIRDAIGGGCSVGVPPDNLGFRLVREPPAWERVRRAVAGWLRLA